MQTWTTIGVTGDEKEETRSRDMKLSRIIFGRWGLCLRGEVHSFPASCLEAGALWGQGERRKAQPSEMSLSQWPRGQRHQDSQVPPHRCEGLMQIECCWNEESGPGTSCPLTYLNQSYRGEEKSRSWQWLCRRCGLRRLQASRPGQWALSRMWQQQVPGGQRGHVRVS